MGPSHACNGAAELTRYLLDTTTLIAHLRGDKSVHAYLLGLLATGHGLKSGFAGSIPAGGGPPLLRFYWSAAGLIHR